WSVGGSSNGLVCMYELARPENPIRVINPLTRKFRELRKPQGRAIDEACKTCCLGFGYDSSTDDYKVVTAIYNRSDPRAHLFNYDQLQTPGILFNGALHWFWVDTNSITYKRVIVSFDLAKEEFREIPEPDDTRYVYGYGSRLGIIEGRLCIYTQAEYIGSPIFVQTLVSPYLNDNERPSYAKQNNNIVKVRSVKEMYGAEDGEAEEEEKHKERVLFHHLSLNTI
ncbi:putative F-box domain-containing protein, partial [Tanacetum coccineum]